MRYKILVYFLVVFGFAICGIRCDSDEVSTVSSETESPVKEEDDPKPENIWNPFLPLLPTRFPITVIVDRDPGHGWGSWSWTTQRPPTRHPVVLTPPPFEGTTATAGLTRWTTAWTSTSTPVTHPTIDGQRYPTVPEWTKNDYQGHTLPPLMPNVMSDSMRRNQSTIPESGHKAPQCIDPSGNEGICQSHHMKCASFYVQYVETQNMNSFKCLLSNGLEGMCCPDMEGSPGIPVLKPTRYNVSLGEFTIEEANRRIRFGSKHVSDIVSIQDQLVEKLLTRRENVNNRNSVSFGHLLFFKTSERAINLSKLGSSLLRITKDIANASARVRDIFELSSLQKGIGLQGFSLRNALSRDELHCLQRPDCIPKFDYYRSIDGLCNNLKEPNLGQSFTPLIRILPPDYEDGVDKPRIGKDLKPLPSTRWISSSLVEDVSVPHSYLTLLVMQFGQFIDHDMSHVPIQRYDKVSGIECCEENGNGPLPNAHPGCYPIEIPEDDPVYGKFRVRCMNFVRSMVAPRIQCNLGYGDQMNQITHWLDNSNIYSSQFKEMRKLRSFKNGLLQTYSNNDNDRIAHEPPPSTLKEMLPQAVENSQNECQITDNKTPGCFRAGDLRVNEQLGLTAMHVIWFREHNRIARLLSEMNPHWDDDILFFESRRIVTAEYQHIIYNEWLPIIVGRQAMEAYQILPLSKGFFEHYDESINPSVSNGFSAAAFRMGHTLIHGLISLVNELGETQETIPLHKTFNEPSRIVEDGILDKIIRGLSQRNIQSFDSFVTSEVTQRLFQPRNMSFGMDLIALNIQRGRDHGLPGYNAFREICQLGKAETFDDFRKNGVMSKQSISRLRKIYKHVDDVDLFVGGLLEKPTGGILGSTFLCLVIDKVRINMFIEWPKYLCNMFIENDKICS